MAPTEKKHGAENPLTHKVGPLPVWAWGALIVGGYLLYSWYKNRSSSSSSGTAAIATGLGAAGGYGSYGGAFSAGGGGGGGGGSSSGGSSSGGSSSTGGTTGGDGSTPGGGSGSPSPGSGGNALTGTALPYPSAPPSFTAPISALLSTSWTSNPTYVKQVNEAALAGESGAPAYVPYFQPQGSTGPPIAQAGVASGPVSGSNLTGSILGAMPGFYQGPGGPGWAVPTLSGGGTTTTFTNGVPTA